MQEICGIVGARICMGSLSVCRCNPFAKLAAPLARLCSFKMREALISPIFVSH